MFIYSPYTSSSFPLNNRKNAASDDEGSHALSPQSNSNSNSSQQNKKNRSPIRKSLLSAAGGSPSKLSSRKSRARSKSPGEKSVDSHETGTNSAASESPKKTKKTLKNALKLVSGVGPVMVPVPLDGVSVQCTQGSVYVKCNTDLTSRLEPDAVVRFGNPFGCDHKLVGVLPPHLLKEQEEEKER